MIESALRAALSEVFDFDEGPRGLLAVRRSARRALASTGFALDSDGAAADSELGGRNPLAALQAPGESYLVRRFTHGGLLRWLTGRRFLDPERPFVEAHLSERLRALGLATPEVIAARAVRALAGAWRLDLVTRRVEGGRDLEAELTQRLARRERAQLFEHFGSWLVRLHACGFLHADLHLKNVLVTRTADGRATLWLLDLDRSALRSALTERERVANLARLVRYAWRRREPLELRRVDFARGLRAYAPARDERRRLWRAIVSRLRSRALAHRAGWWLEARAGR